MNLFDFAEARRKARVRAADPGDSGGLIGPRSAAELLVTCVECRRLHAPSDPVAFSPVCLACAPPHPLGQLGMSGPFPLTYTGVGRALRWTAPGNYALGYRDGPTFLVFYVGRSDADLRASLRAWVGAPSPCSQRRPSAQAPWSLRAGRGHDFAAPALASADAAVASSYTCFAFSFAIDAEEAFEKECRNFEDFGAARVLDNALHPVVRRDHASTGGRRAARSSLIRVVRSAPARIPRRSD